MTDTKALLSQAEATYPPTTIVMRTVCRRIGTASKIANNLRLGTYGARVVRKWTSNPAYMPFSVWLALLAMHEVAE